MNPDLDRLQPYPFERLAQLNAGVQPPADKPPISLSIGEPRHAPPAFALKTYETALTRFSNYPTTKGLPELNQSVADWATRRFGLGKGLDPAAQVVPVNGTREAIFSFVQACLNRAEKPVVVYQNPFYQIYEGATILAGGEPFLLDCRPENGYLPDFDSVPAEIWQRCQLVFVCSPGNPTGTIVDKAAYQRLLALADEYDFVIASDECYSEIYQDESAPPTGLLQVCAETGRHDFRRCVVFHSLSKRSNMPGMRSGFIAGDASLLRPYLRYRTYHGCAMPVPTQLTSIELWQDEAHVLENRDLYRQKYRIFTDILEGVLPLNVPPASFYLWPQTPWSDEQFARDLLAQENVHILPGRYLGRENNGSNPGDNHCRLALVSSVDDCEIAARRIRQFIERNQ